MPASDIWLAVFKFRLFFWFHFSSDASLMRQRWWMNSCMSCYPRRSPKLGFPASSFSLTLPYVLGTFWKRTACVSVFHCLSTCLVNVRHYYKAVAIDTFWYWYKIREDLWNKAYTHSQLLFGKKTENNPAKFRIFNKCCWDNWVLELRNKTPNFHLVEK